jgi:hypothetical protein
VTVVSELVDHVEEGSERHRALDLAGVARQDTHSALLAATREFTQQAAFPDTGRPLHESGPESYVASVAEPFEQRQLVAAAYEFREAVLPWRRRGRAPRGGPGGDVHVPTSASSACSDRRNGLGIVDCSPRRLIEVHSIG